MSHQYSGAPAIAGLLPSGHSSGRTAFTTYTPGMVHQIVRPGQDLYIRIFTIQAGQAPPPGTFADDEIIKYVGSRVERPAN